ncbi:hypothetical protein SDJN03_03137, partial [Cucurbita argyrosperma subsp. sororia]
MVGEVGASRDGAGGPGKAVLPAILPVLDAAPMNEEGLVQVVEDVDNDVVVGGGVDVRAGELAVDEYALLGDAKRRDGAVGDLPSEEEVRIFGADRPERCSGETEQEGKQEQPRTHFGSSLWFGT